MSLRINKRVRLFNYSTKKASNTDPDLKPWLKFWFAREQFLEKAIHKNLYFWTNVDLEGPGYFFSAFIAISRTF